MSDTENSTEEKVVKDQRRLLKSSGIVSLMTMVSRVFGLVRDMVIAYFFGAGAGADSGGG